MSDPLLTFLHVAKTGGRSVETALRSTYGLRYVHAIPWRRPLGPGEEGRPLATATYDHRDFRRLQRLSPGMRAVGGHALTVWSGLHELRPVRYFAFLRDPVRRMASHYQFHRTTVSRPLDLDAWLRWQEPREHQLKFFSRSADPQEAIETIQRHGIFIGLLEEFDASLVLLQRLLAPELALGYRRTNRAANNEVARALLDDPKERARLATMVRGEQVLYDWVRSTWYPSQVERYGAGLESAVARLQAEPEAGFKRWNDALNRACVRFWFNPWVRAHRRRQA
ncbi:MAG: hypothetical protein R6X25_09275 [Candidatus Krumholzibacteriia bacterium]